MSKYWKMRKEWFARSKARRQAVTKTEVKTMINRSIAAEIVQHDTNVDDADVYTTPYVSVPISTKIGDNGDTTVYSIDIRGILELQSSTDTHLVRLVLVRDHLNSATAIAPAWADVFKEEEIFSHRAFLDGAYEVDPRFSVIYDRTFSLTNDAASSESRKQFRIYKRYKGLQCTMDGVHSRGSKNGFYIMAIATCATTELDLSYSARVKYKD